jgi:PBP1b-binding outer membrane lipoprotein LpoB
MRPTIVMVVLFAALLAGCAAPTPAPAVEVTRLVEQTVLVTQIITTTPEPDRNPPAHNHQHARTHQRPYHC